MRNFVQSRILPLVFGSTAATILINIGSPAKALDFNFQINDSYGGTGGQIQGTIYGLTDNSTSAASSVVITSYPNASAFTGQAPSAPFSVESWIPSPTLNDNSFTVVNGVITSAEYARISYTSQDFVLNDISGQNFLQVFQSGTQVLEGNHGGFSGATYTPVSSAVPFDIPGGATIPVLGSLLTLGVTRKIRKFTSK